ncbi:MAG TPA: DMT family transporter [Thermoanaerobaculia bacterium]|nr:DMT family transporter [Thermoanaerobaculia bacterium]
MPATSDLSPYAGQLAALGTAACWAFSALIFAAAARRIGVLALNLFRLVAGMGFLSLAAWALRGAALPTDVSAHAWVWLGVSGLIGFVFGDLCLFLAYGKIGTRLASLMMALSPPMTAVIGWLVLGETLTGRDVLGMTLTVGGIAWAVLERHPEAEGSAPAPRASLSGLVLGAGGALGQAGGLVLSKLGMGGYHPVAATQVRVLAGIAGYAVLLTALRWWPKVGEAAGDGRALGLSTLGAFFGPFLGVSLSLFAVRHTVAGVAASIMALQPVMIIPLVVLLHRERVGFGGVAGALVAVAGVALLFL